MISNKDFDRLIDKGQLEAGDVLFLRSELYGDDHAISADEADVIFRLNDACESVSKEWMDFFVEALVEYTIHQAEPKGYISQDNADWLIERIDHDGLVKSTTELELLIKVLETANDIPENFQVYVIHQVKSAVLTGEGPTRSGEDLKIGHIGRAEVDLVRRALYASGSRDGIAISKKEAQMLFDLNDVVTDVSNDASWPDLFVKAIANYLMASRGYMGLSREEALRREAWLDSEPNTGITNFFGKIVEGGLHAVIEAYKYKEEDYGAKTRTEIARSEPISEDEADWLINRIGNDGKLCDSEKALLMFIKTESPNIHPRLKPLLTQV